MVNGIEIFKQHFQGYAERYVLIGGAACDIAMDQAGISFRATKDLDIVLLLEALDAEFVTRFWEFVRLGGYSTKETSSGLKQFYRFQKPTSHDFPFMLELFSRRPDVLTAPEGIHLVPLPMDEEVSSLSAILLDNDYYNFIQTGRRELAGLPYLGAEHLLPLKAKAWLDLTRRQKAGESVDSRNIRKHRNDIFRLYQIIDPAVTATAATVSAVVMRDLRNCLSALRDEDINMKDLGFRRETNDEVLNAISERYKLIQ